MSIVVSYAQSISVDVDDNDDVDTMLEKIKNEVRYQLYGGGEYLEFIIIDCEERPELIDEMLD